MPDDRGPGGRLSGLVVRVFTAAHLGLIAASVAAFFLVVNRPVPAGVDRELWARVYHLGMVWTGPLYILTGFVAAVAGLWRVAGTRSTIVVVSGVALAGLGLELLGTATGVPFGEYGYGSQLGFKVAGLVPAVIPLSWYLMLYASLGIAARVTTRPGGLIVLGSLGLVAWDVLMDPAMTTAFPFWSWHSGGIYYGMPLINWLGWFLTGLILAAIAVGHDRQAVIALRTQRLPHLLYVANGLFPLGLALQSGLGGVALIGSAAMGLFAIAPLVPGLLRLAVGTRPVGRVGPLG